MICIKRSSILAVRSCAGTPLNSLRLAEKELLQIDKQIVAAILRRAIAAQDLSNQNKLIELAQKENNMG